MYVRSSLLSILSLLQSPLSFNLFSSHQIRERVHATLLELDMPNLIDHGQTESGKLKSVTLR